MKPGLLFAATFLLSASEATTPKAQRPQQDGLAPPSGTKPGQNRTAAIPPLEECELRGQAALVVSVVALTAFLMGFLAIAWMLSFVSFIAASMVLLDESRGHYWPARLALLLSLIFVLGLMGFVLIYS